MFWAIFYFFSVWYALCVYLELFGMCLSQFKLRVIFVNEKSKTDPLMNHLLYLLCL